MDSLRLVRDELEYELRVRGYENLSSVSVAEMRKTLYKDLKTEKVGDLKCAVELDADTELEICSNKFRELQTLAEQITSPTHINEYKKFATNLSHVLGRLARIKTIKLEVTDQLCLQLADLEDRVLQITDSEILTASLPNTDNSRLPTEPLVTQTAATPRPIPVSKWNLSFSGDGTGLSINAFLERVGEFKLSRRVSDQELLDSAIELLTGDALIWYRSVQSKANTWTELAKLMREEFEPAGYEFELWAEIRSRSQGPSERVGSYFARMINLFARLPHPPSEEETLSVLRRNIAPYYIHHVGLTEVKTVDDLLSICKRLENNRYLADNFQPPTCHRRPLLEPDLACPTSKARVCTSFTPRSQYAGIVHVKAICLKIVVSAVILFVTLVANAISRLETAQTATLVNRNDYQLDIDLKTHILRDILNLIKMSLKIGYKLFATST